MKNLFALLLYIFFAVSNCFCQTTDDEKYEQAYTFYKAKEYKKALPLLKELTNNNYPEAMCLLGECFDFGRGVNKDIKKAVELYQRSADMGCARSLNNIGSCYQYGDGVEKNVVKAYEYYIKATEQHYAKAQLNLGWLYQDNDFLQKMEIRPKGDWEVYQFQQSEKWFRLAARNGLADGYYGLGCLYDTQLDYNGNIEKAYKLYEKSAEMGSLSGQAEMAFICFCHGEMENARVWFEKADNNRATDDFIIIRGFKYELIKMIFDFFCQNKRYTYNGIIETYDYNIFLEGNYIYVGVNVVEKGTSGFLKLIPKGRTLSMMSGLYEYYFDNDNDVMRFKELK